jgi:23S rRNA C2498 (ribose-2'-O)-methylase RlmM
MSQPSPAPSQWLVRISEVFAPFLGEILDCLGAKPLKTLGSEYHLVQFDEPSAWQKTSAARFVRWNLPVHHAWPCNPQKMDGFVEKAAQAIQRKFADAKPQALFIGQLDPGAPHKYYKTLASNLRGRTLQLFPALAGSPDVEAQDPTAPTLFCLVGKEGLFCGLQSPQASNGFFPGGTKYISQSAPGTISRAGGKIAEALHYLPLRHAPLAEGSHWLELGASPGGMTSELLRRGFRVTAVDRAPLDSRLARMENLSFIHGDAASFTPPAGTTYDALLSDLNGDAHDSIGYVIRLSRSLRPGGLVVFTLKMPNVTTLGEANALFDQIEYAADRAKLSLFARTHLTYNRQELTLFFEKRA